MNIDKVTKNKTSNQQYLSVHVQPIHFYARHCQLTNRKVYLKYKHKVDCIMSKHCHHDENFDTAFSKQRELQLTNCFA